MRSVAVAVVGQLHQPRISAAVSSRSTHKTTASGLHDSHSTVDLRSVAQSKHYKYRFVC